MAADKATIAKWFDGGVSRGLPFMIVVCDGFSHEDFPMYVLPGDDVRKRVEEIRHQGDRVMEVYALGRDKAAQLAESHAWAEEAREPEDKDEQPFVFKTFRYAPENPMLTAEIDGESWISVVGRVSRERGISLEEAARIVGAALAEALKRAAEKGDKP